MYDSIYNVNATGGNFLTPELPGGVF